MIRINLLPVREIYAEVTRRRDLTVGGLTLALTVLALAGVHFFQARHFRQLEEELARVRQEVQALNTKVREVGELQAKIKDFQSKHKIIEDLNKQKAGPVRVMESMSAATPSNLWLTEFKETNGTTVINGLALDNQTIADFMRSLSQSPYFRDVELVETTQADEKTGPYKKFSIRTSVVYREPAPKSLPPGGAKDGQRP